MNTISFLTGVSHSQQSADNILISDEIKQKTVNSVSDLLNSNYIFPDKAKKIEVIPANDGKKPMFFGGSADIHPKIREKMFEILFSDVTFDFLDQASSDELETMRKEFSVFNIKDLEKERPLLMTDLHAQFFTFTGTRINRTLQILFNITGVKCTMDAISSSFYINPLNENITKKLSNLLYSLTEIDSHIHETLQTNPGILSFSKWGKYLPESFQSQLLKDKYFDIPGTKEYLSRMSFIHPECV